MRSSSCSLWWLAVICVLAAGCYSFETVRTPAPGDDVRARLTSEAAVSHSQGFEEPVLHYDGTVVESRGDSLVLNVLIARSSSMFQDVEIRDTVRLGTGEIQAIQGRRLSLGKTLLFTVAAGVGAYAVIRGIDQVVGGTVDDGDDGGTPLRVPVPGLGGTYFQLIIRRSP